MNPRNRRHLTIQQVKELWRDKVEGDLDAGEIDFAIHNQTGNFNLLHPLLIESYSMYRPHHRDTPFGIVGLDIETNAETGEPRLMGFAYEDDYEQLEYPDLLDFYKVIKGLIDNESDTQLVTWGNLDLQCILRLFEPDETERYFISRGLAGRFKDGKFIASPPIKREIDGNTFFVDHYMSQRALRLGIVFGSRAYSIWIYNVSQFYPGTIAKTAKTLKMEWIDFDRDTHLINWDRFAEDQEYYDLCIASNKQDAITVRKLALSVMDTFHRVFDCYPALLVSHGSLADACVSKMLSEQEYQSNSWRWLTYNVWRKSQDVVRKAETLLSEAFSAGYVDQFAVGYTDEAFTADISSAYPHKIRALPDLRDSVLIEGSGNIDKDIRDLRKQRLFFLTAVFRGVVTIPEELEFHPITVRTKSRQNIRRTGTFGASYFWNERDYCKKRGAKFELEEYVIIALKKRRLAPIARVSDKLRILRDEYIKKRDESDESERVVWDGMQYMVKVVDNSLYGKTVMTTPVVKNIDDKPEITGRKAGDRYNQLYGGLITSDTRIQEAEAAMEIKERGGKVLLIMTDSLYWVGRADMLDERRIRPEKTAGYFEPVSVVKDFYLIKTGQYEYREEKEDCPLHTGSGLECKCKWNHKMRGLNVPYERKASDRSFYRDLIKGFVKDKQLPNYALPQEISIPIDTKRLVTIGNVNLDKLGLIEDGMSELKPFMLSGKQTEGVLLKWYDALDGLVWLAPITGGVGYGLQTPLAFMRELYEAEQEFDYTIYQRKLMYVWTAINNNPTLYRTLGKSISNCSWEELQVWAGQT